METLGSFNYNQEGAIPKIQTEIKNFLKCDVVLTEYIIVLLRNNKTKKEIFTDVSEFLIGNESVVESFVNWLWEFIPNYFATNSKSKQPTTTPITSGAATNNKKLPTPKAPSNRMILSAVKQASDDTKNLNATMDGIEVENGSNNNIPQDLNNNGYFNKNGKKNHNKRNNEEKTRFTITMDGLNKTSGAVSRKRKSRRNEDDDDEEKQDDDEILEPQDEETQEEYGRKKRTGKKEKCQFWPSCKFGDKCEFHHPNSPCMFFPKCPHGENCLFIHPSIPCKYGVDCTNKECPYNHPQRMFFPTSAPPSMKDIPCRNGFACTNITSGCGFGHPPFACTFGTSCKNQSCTYSHSKICRNGSECSRQGCTFAHSRGTESSIPCKHGKECANKTCKFQHPERELEALSSTLPSTPPSTTTNENDTNMAETTTPNNGETTETI